MYEKTYSYTLHPINGQLLWPITESEEILAPVSKKMTGRPKKKRKREKAEAPPTGSQISRKGRVMRCSICKQEGHNKASCTSNTTTTIDMNEERGRSSTSGRGRGRSSTSACTAE
ncbi:unnamed protein product [Cuscuta europaea]|uniref:Uncharacterized protein n=1 Tax=Cuscuta europaea TaxID=41803 RepID=A0A9P0ZU46_CUSEU|nr:unnamed protein product [Cuscuta europaea]